MESSQLLIILIIALLSIVQSVFGVGLLVFGTPTFMLLGADYVDAVSYLLPPSLILSSFQSYKYRNKIRIARGIIKYSVPFVFIGMSLAVNIEKQSVLIIIIGIMLLVLSIMKFVGVNFASTTLKRHAKIPLVFTGMIHGLTNQGGALLTIIMSSIYDDKEKIRTNIAFAYLLFGLAQFIVLLVFRAGEINLLSIVYIIVAIAVYILFGRLVFESIDGKYFDLFFTFLMFLYGILLIAQEI